LLAIVGVGNGFTVIDPVPVARQPPAPVLPNTVYVELVVGENATVVAFDPPGAQV
jgi:hypothetical protein